MSRASEKTSIFSILLERWWRALARCYGLSRPEPADAFAQDEALTSLLEEAEQLILGRSLSGQEAAPPLGPVRYPFSILRDAPTAWLSAEALDWSLIPLHPHAPATDGLSRHVEAYLQEALMVPPEHQAHHLSLLERYFGQLCRVHTGEPFQPNVYDELRLVLGLAHALSPQADPPQSSGASGEAAEAPPSPLALLKLDLSGIQDFLFDIPSDKAARQLKGRSFYLQILTTLAGHDLIRHFGLSPANVLYDGGGNSYLLLPGGIKNKLSDYIKQYNIKLIGKGLLLSWGWVGVEKADLKDFSQKWSAVHQQLMQQKTRRYADIPYSVLFSPQKLQGDEKQQTEDEYFKTLSEHLQGPYFRIGPKTSQNKKLMADLGETAVHWSAARAGAAETQVWWNTTQLEPQSTTDQSFRPGVVRLPHWRAETVADFQGHWPVEDIDRKIDPPKAGNRIDFSQMAERARQRGQAPLLGVMKMDVDNLGKVFSEYLRPEARGGAQVASLSRYLRWFFEGHMHHLIQKHPDDLYPLFSGGDDFFILGGWDVVFDFALEVHQAFRAFTAEHPLVTLSGGLITVAPTFPMIRIGQMAEARLEEAKNYQRRVRRATVEKNAVNVWETNLSWSDFEKARQLRDKLVQLVVEYHQPRAFLQKILMSTRGLNALLEQIYRKGVVDFPKVHRLAYYLRDMPTGINPKKEADKYQQVVNLKEDIVGHYEKLMIDAMTQKTEHNPGLFAVAARWAELATRETRVHAETEET